jgi:hypothetical protein
MLLAFRLWHNVLTTGSGIYLLFTRGLGPLPPLSLIVRAIALKGRVWRRPKPRL